MADSAASPDRLDRGLWPALAPMLLPAFLILLFVPLCEDGWCAGAISQMVGTWIVTLIVLVIAFLAARSVALRPAAAGLVAWLVAGTGLAVLFAASQIYEGDGGTAAAGILIALLLAGGALLVARDPRSRSTTPRPP